MSGHGRQWSRAALAAFACLAALAALGCGSSSSTSSTSTTSSATSSSTATSTTSRSTSTTAGGSDYDPVAEQNFLDACEQSAPDSACECTLRKVEAAIPYSKFVDIDRAMRAGASAPRALIRLAQSCAGS